MKKLLIFALIATLLLAFAGCGEKIPEERINADYNPINPDAVSTTIAKLIKNPEKFDGEIVRVEGIGVFSIEHDALFVSKNHLGDKENGVRLRLGPLAMSHQQAINLSGRMVVVEGTFDMTQTGADGSWHGAIVDITRYEVID